MYSLQHMVLHICASPIKEDLSHKRVDFLILYRYHLTAIRKNMIYYIAFILIKQNENE